MKTDSKLIAIIEDDAVLRRGLRLVFVGEKFRVTTYSDVIGLFENFAKAMPDVVLCDYKLPSTNGIEILKEFRKNDNATPFFLMTGYYKDELANLAKENGANAVFEKPLNLEELLDSCRSAVNN